MAITLDMKCSKCGVTLRRQMLLAMLIDAGAKTRDPCLCPEGGDHDFCDKDEYAEKMKKKQAVAGA